MSEKENENKNKPVIKVVKLGPWFFPILAVSIILLINFFNGGFDMNYPKSTSISSFYDLLNKNQIEKVDILTSTSGNTAEITLKKAAYKSSKDEELKKLTKEKGPHYLVKDVGSLELFQKRLEEAKGKNLISVYDLKPTSNWGEWIGLLLPTLIFIGFFYFISKRMSGGAGGGGQIFSIGKSKAKLFDEKNDVKVTFENVAGLEGAKEEIQEIVEFLKTPEKYTSIGGKIPKGALLVGPPGTGKTLLAKAVAGEANVPFFSLSGSDFVEMFVGVGASRVRDLFKQAKDKAPAIIFIDEIDAVGRARGKNNMSGSNDERENTLNQLLTEMDGFGTNSNVIVLAATNRADVLDKALMRAGRFDRQIYVDLPDIRERAAIFEVHLKPITKSETLDVEFLAKQTPGFSGADIANVCNEAALVAARKDKKAVDKQDFLDAVDRIVGGLEKKNKIITKEEKHAIAIHEAGHATVSWMLKHAAPLVKVTIVPRGQSLGAAWYLPEERQIVRTEQMLDEMCATMGGRAAEKVVFDKISTGALSDLEKVTKQARAMVTVYGLNDKIGNITYYDSSGQSDYNFSKPYSDDTAKIIDAEISGLIEKQYQRAITILTENRTKLEALADILIEKEVIFKDDLETIFGKRPFDIEEVKPETMTEIISKSDSESITE
ncbi:ATP-dependent zinc metalloprotease FtsH [Flavobacterium terrigena]|uniref:ATP-dependent zinc metalloprotease FtsH n=1 Tax=Flavobacterium terrigena TaxID=402734 RepID=A0A1H6RLU5_9FLAO|nr:ATP-dependent zinc metalloprotease FtsH [Flavobacterium terrigena]SEI56731.1 cell division protease FtsH [Flavobacterium terrigena]